MASRSDRKTAATLVKGPVDPEEPGPHARAPAGGDLVDEGQIGVGGSGSVRRAFDPKLQRRVAVKTLWPRLARHPRAVARFIEEAQITAQLEHPNIVPVHGLTVNERGRTYFTMRLIEGRTLSAVIGEAGARAADSERLYELLQIFLKVCEAVAFAHSRGVIHCDIKPENIMVGTFGEVHLMDWGLAAVREPVFDEPPLAPAAGRRRPGVKGTPAYMAPEQAEGNTRALGERTDVFGLGTVLYRMLTGRAPFEGKTVTESLARARRCEFVSPQDLPGPPLPAPLVRIALRAMSARPEDRYPSVLALRKDVDQFLRGGWHLPTRQFPAGALIVEEGDRGDAAYILVAGTCEVSKLIDGERRVLRQLGPGSVFGEMAILCGDVRTATVRALDEVTVKVVTRALLQEQLGVDTWLGQLVLALADRFRELDERFGRGELKPGTTGGDQPG